MGSKRGSKVMIEINRNQLLNYISEELIGYNLLKYYKRKLIFYSKCSVFTNVFLSDFFFVVGGVGMGDRVEL